MKKNIHKLIALVLIVLMAFPNCIFAEDTNPTIRTLLSDSTSDFKEVKNENFDDMFEKVPLDLTSYTTNFGDKTEFSGTNHYEVKYKDAITYKGQKLSLKISVDVTNFVSPTDYNAGTHTDGHYYNGVEIIQDSGDNNHRLLITSYFRGVNIPKVVNQFTPAQTTNYNVTYTFYDKNDNEFKFTGLIGIDDPDNANYILYNAVNRFIYFKDGFGQEVWNKEDGAYPQKAANEFRVVTCGQSGQDYKIYRDLETGIKNGVYTKDGGAFDAQLGGFTGTGLYVYLDKDQSYTFGVEGWRDRVFCPELYVMKTYTVTYLDGVADEEVFTDQVNPNLFYKEPTPEFDTTDPSGEPVREGYAFMGWTEDGAAVDIPELVTRDATYVATWAKKEKYVVEYYYQKNGVYSDTPDYDDQSRTALANVLVSVTDDDKDPKKDGYVLDSDEAKNVWSKAVVAEGDLNYPTTLKVYFKEQFTVVYEPGTQGKFDPQTTEELDYGVPTPAGPDTSNHNEGFDFAGWSPAVEDIVTKNMTYVAQWEPWKYTIAYDANGGYGDMPDDNFIYTDAKMESDLNRFKRDGYSFEGFVYTAPDGKQSFYKDIFDFKPILIALGKNSKIVLVAQWDKLPDRGGSGYAIPVTGID